MSCMLRVRGGGAKEGIGVLLEQGKRERAKGSCKLKGTSQGLRRRPGKKGLEN